MIRVIFILFLLLNFLFANDLEIERIFKKYDIEGTFVLSSLKNINFIYNEKRVKQRFIPASTFKIPHTLIALEEKVVDTNTIIKWDGKKRFYEPWNKNQTLQSAIKYSCVWCFQTFAQKIDNNTYLKYLEKIDYGNKKTGKDKTTFWLDGDLKISAFEQINFLKKLYRDNLPFKKKNLEIAKTLIINEQTQNYTIRGKTGWAQDIAWYIGYIETNSNIWFFALNANIKEMKNLKLREKIVKEILESKKII
jgi:beta-lactamase class D